MIGGLALLVAVGAITPLAAAEPTAAADFPITYQLDRPAQVSLLVCDASGAVVRELLHGAARPAGPDTVRWDGLDEQGKAVPAGNYTWKLRSSSGLKAEYLLTIGTDTVPSWQLWPGNHGPVCAVAVDADVMYAATGCGEVGQNSANRSCTKARLVRVTRSSWACAAAISAGCRWPKFSAE